VSQIEGRRPVIEALRAKRAISEVLLAEGSKPSGALAEIVRLAHRHGVPVREIPKKELESRAQSKNPQGVIASAEADFAYVPLAAIVDRANASRQPALILALDGVTDPMNLGALARSAEAAGAHGLVVPKRRAAPVTPAAEKASAGALEHLPVAQVSNLARAIEELKESGVWIAALDAEAEQTIYDLDATGALCIVIGSEGEGVSRLILDRADYRVNIPMSGKVGSLNASAAGAVALFEVRRQRSGGSGGSPPTR
jgi:23S rRNA (guanosine2251-2'-O)-methyltransferase